MSNLTKALVAYRRRWFLLGGDYPSHDGQKLHEAALEAVILALREPIDRDDYPLRESSVPSDG